MYTYDVDCYAHLNIFPYPNIYKIKDMGETMNRSINRKGMNEVSENLGSAIGSRIVLLQQIKQNSNYPYLCLWHNYN